MRTCQKCGQPNRNEARYCKWCGTLLEAVAQPSAGGDSALPEAADFIAKDNILPTFRSFAARCEHASEFIQLSGGTSRPGLDCIIPKHVDAADWDGFNGKLDENLAKIKKGVLLVTNCQDLVGDYKNALDKLFARMRKGTEMPVVILCGLEDGFGSYIRSNKHVSSLFEFSFGLLPFNDAHLTSLCSSIITGKFRTSISPEAQKKLGLVFKKKFRDGLSGENGKLACRLAEAYTLNKIERCGRNGPLEEADIPDEPFKELTEEEIFEKLDSFVGLKEVKDEVLPVALLGDGYGILPTTNNGVVYAPVDGVIGATTMTNHSIVIAAEGGMEVLIHIGIGTVNMGGKGFSRCVETGDTVRAGQPIMTFNDDSIKQAGYEDVVCCTISNPDAFSQIDHVGDTSTLLDGRPLVKIGDPLLVARRA